MSLAKDDCASGLIVLEADHGLVKKTPVAQFNKEEQRQAMRDETEVHASYSIRPGDRICEVHAEALDKTLKTLGHCRAEQQEEDSKTMSASAMLYELNAATSETSPRVINLAISRNLDNVLQPCSSPHGSRPSSRASVGDSAAASRLGKCRRSSSVSSISIASRRSSSSSSISTASSVPDTPPRFNAKQKVKRHDERMQALPPIMQRVLPTLKVC
jgi:hypothetical protein